VVLIRFWAPLLQLVVEEVEHLVAEPQPQVLLEVLVVAEAKTVVQVVHEPHL
jgi:hypothetical protein